MWDSHQRWTRWPSSAAALNAWLDTYADELAPRYDMPGTLDDQVAQMQRVKALLFDAGWMRYGWPERVGGLGGSPLHAHRTRRDAWRGAP